MASSSQVRSRADRKTHMLNVPSSSSSSSSSSRLEPGPGRPALMCGTSYRIEVCISGVAGSQVGRTAGHVSLVFAATRRAAR
jgi:hypothetical protein